jgi:AraC family transcriptional regulator
MWRSPSCPITLGTRLRSRETSGFLFTETSHAAGTRLYRHHHETANVAIVLSGSFTEQFSHCTFECGPRSLVVKPPGEPHSDEYGSRGMRGLLVEVTPRGLERLGPVSGALGRVQQISGGPATWCAARLHREFIRRDAASSLALEAIALELLVELTRRNPVGSRRRPRWIDDVVDAIRCRFEERLDLAALAAVAGVHPVHLAREFRRHCGCTPGDYLRAVRIDAAAAALSGTDRPLVEIAMAAGFSHQAHFCRVFKRCTGLSPSEFRRAHRSR